MQMGVENFPRETRIVCMHATHILRKCTGKKGNICSEDREVRGVLLALIFISSLFPFSSPATDNKRRTIFTLRPERIYMSFFIFIYPPPAPTDIQI